MTSLSSLRVLAFGVTGALLACSSTSSLEVSATGGASTARGGSSASGAGATTLGGASSGGSGSSQGGVLDTSGGSSVSSGASSSGGADGLGGSGGSTSGSAGSGGITSGFAGSGATAGSGGSSGSANGGAGGSGAGGGSAGSGGVTRSAGCGKAFTRPNAADKQTLSVAGANRIYQLFVPAQYTADTAWPLVVTFHGGGGSSASSRAEMNLESARDGGGVVVYLNYVNNGWSYADGSADLAYFEAVTAAVEDKFCVDTRRVLVTGFSLGAIMTNGMGCLKGGNEVRAIVPIDGSGPDPEPAPASESVLACPTGTPTGHPVTMVIHGTADTTALFKYGQWTANYWRKWNGCTDATVTLSAPMANCIAYQGCQVTTDFCTHPGNHMVPSTAGGLIWALMATLK